MRKVFQFMMISADGYFEAPGHSLEWHNAANEEFGSFADNQLDTADTIVFGRITFGMMEKFWPRDEAIQLNPSTAERMNSMEKIVFSRTALDTDWTHATVVTRDPVQVLGEMKAGEGKDIAILGSSNLCLELLPAGIIDEVRLMVNPVILGNGTSLFSGLPAHLNLRLLSTRNFESGNVLLTYAPIVSPQV